MKVYNFMVIAKRKDKTFWFGAKSQAKIKAMLPEKVLKEFDEIIGYRYTKEGYVECFKDINRKIGF